jgi:hypothetical protein
VARGEVDPFRVDEDGTLGEAAMDDGDDDGVTQV